jgi:hypothetical protein
LLDRVVFVIYSERFGGSPRAIAEDLLCCVYGQLAEDNVIQSASSDNEVISVPQSNGHQQQQ